MNKLSSPGCHTCPSCPQGTGLGRRRLCCPGSRGCRSRTARSRRAASPGSHPLRPRVWHRPLQPRLHNSPLAPKSTGRDAEAGPNSHTGCEWQTDPGPAAVTSPWGQRPGLVLQGSGPSPSRDRTGLGAISPGEQGLPPAAVGQPPWAIPERKGQCWTPQPSLWGADPRQALSFPVADTGGKAAQVSGTAEKNHCGLRAEVFLYSCEVPF